MSEIKWPEYLIDQVHPMSVPVETCETLPISVSDPGAQYVPPELVDIVLASMTRPFDQQSRRFLDESDSWEGALARAEGVERRRREREGDILDQLNFGCGGDSARARAPAEETENPADGFSAYDSTPDPKWGTDTGVTDTGRASDGQPDLDGAETTADTAKDAATTPYCAPDDEKTFCRDEDGDGYAFYNEAVCPKQCLSPNPDDPKWIPWDKNKKDDCVDNPDNPTTKDTGVPASAINPGALEKCNNVDDDCKNGKDDADTANVPIDRKKWYIDSDGDGYAKSTVFLLACDNPDATLYVGEETLEKSQEGGEVILDCDNADNDKTIYPGAVEDCADGEDNDCDGLTDAKDISPDKDSDDICDGDLVGRWKLNEQSGDVANDSSLNGYDGALIGSPTWEDAKGKHGLHFAGVGDGVNNAASALILSAQLTVAAWIKLDNPPFINVDLDGDGDIDTVEAVSFLNKYTGGGNDKGWYLSYSVADPNNNPRRLSFRTATTAGGCQFETAGMKPAINDPIYDQWQHVAATYDGVSAKIYVDGEAVQNGVSEGCSVPAEMLTSTNDFAIGHEGWNTFGWFKGFLRGVHIYKRALKPEEIKMLYNKQL